MRHDLILVGIGHPDRGDDSVGPLAIEALKKRLPTVKMRSILGDVSSLIDIFANHACVILIDAITSGAKSGTIFRLEENLLNELAQSCRSSTHTFDLSQILEIANNLNSLPDKLIIFGMEGANFSVGEGLSLPVVAQFDTFVDSIYKEVQKILRG
ncbi:MAG: hydrogenase maturation protease [Proteobacteria bacterium]|nr:hydrogenase maturation protease [Pseudomonadota bacterium]